ncbi:hypothetical protein D3C72_2346730 [compost metagenome]
MVRNIFGQCDGFSALHRSAVTDGDTLAEQLPAQLTGRLRLQPMAYSRQQGKPGMPRPLPHPEDARRFVIAGIFLQQAGFSAA